MRNPTRREVARLVLASYRQVCENAGLNSPSFKTLRGFIVFSLCLYRSPAAPYWPKKGQEGSHWRTLRWAPRISGDDDEWSYFNSVGGDRTYFVGFEIVMMMIAKVSHDLKVSFYNLKKNGVVVASQRISAMMVAVENDCSDAIMSYWIKLSLPINT